MKLFISFALFFVSEFIIAQVSIKDSSIYTPFIGVSYGYDLPAGDLISRFGNSSAIGLSLDFKSKSYITIGICGSYFFGKTVKEDIFKNIANPDGSIVNKNGELADVRVFERGFITAVRLGKMFAFKKPNPNSGILFELNFGFMQHKIRIETIGNNVPQLGKDYKKGYDRLSNGFMLAENLGYLYLSNNRLINIYFGFECQQGFTQNRRTFDYDTMQHDSKKRLDVLYGFKLAWILPLYKKAPKEFYTH